MPATPATPATATTMTEPPSARWFALAVTMLAGLLASIQTTALIVALTDLLIKLHAEFITIIWVLLSFNAAVAAVCPLLGFFADSGVKGTRCIMFNCGFAVFGLGSLLAGFAQPSSKGIDLVIYRALMGIGAAFIFNNSAPILADKFFAYNQVGLSQGLWGMSFALGSVIGPVVGGGLLNAVGWQWIFFFNVPFCALGCIIGFWKVNDAPVPADPNVKVPTVSTVIHRFDFLGAVLICFAIVCLFVGITSALFPSDQLSGTSTIAAFLACAGVSSILFVVWEMQRQANFPIVDFAMFKIRDFTLLCIGSLEVAITRGALTFAFIFYFQGAQNLGALDAGIRVIPQGVGTLIAGFVAGALTDRIGYRNLCIIGALVGAAGCVGACFVTADTNYWATAATLFVAGAGGGIYNSPSSALGVLCVAKERRGQSNALRFMITQVSAMFAIVICFTLIVGSLPPAVVGAVFLGTGAHLAPDQLATFVQGFQDVMWVCFGLQILLALVSVPLTAAVIKSPAVAVAVQNKLADDEKGVALTPIATLQPTENDVTKTV